MPSVWSRVLDKAEREWESDPRELVAIRLLIFTGCRSAEILGLRWEDVDIERRCLHLPDSKTGKRAPFRCQPVSWTLVGLPPIPSSKPTT